MDMQQKLNDAGLGHIKVIDKDHVEAVVDGEPTIFSRDDDYAGHPMSGLAYYGSVSGDHRMIRAIYDDMAAAFEIIK